MNIFPHRVSIAGLAFALLGFILVAFMLIGLSIWFNHMDIVNYVHHLELTQVKQAAGECKALHTLDESGNGVSFPKINAAHPSETVLSRMLAGIHGVYVTSKCQALLSGHYKLPG